MDTLAIVSLICLIAAIALGFFFKVNIGIIAVGAALVLGKLSGIEDGTILKYFNSTLFMRLLGVLLLFSIAQANGTIEKLTRRAVYSMRKIPRLIPILIFIISAANAWAFSGKRRAKGHKTWFLHQQKDQKEHLPPNVFGEQQ